MIMIAIPPDLLYLESEVKYPARDNKTAKEQEWKTN
jgi:hypothetical protein